MDEGVTEPLPFINNEVTVWVEWSSPTHGFATLTLIDAVTSQAFDTVRFHSFRSVIVAFGGNTDNPADENNDGSIGDPGEGLFDIAQFMYNTGWDVLAFNEEDVDAVEDVPFTEIVNGLEQRFAEYYSIIGYSQGGGAAHDLIERLWDEKDYFALAGVFLDAVDHDGMASENDWPDVAFYLLNIYQEIQMLGGGEISEFEPFPGTVLEQVNVTNDEGWDHDLNHFAIDDNLQVKQLITTRLQQYIPSR